MEVIDRGREKYHRGGRGDKRGSNLEAAPEFCDRCRPVSQPHLFGGFEQPRLLHRRVAVVGDDDAAGEQS